MLHMQNSSKWLDLYLGVLLVLDSHDCAILSPGCYLQVIWHTVFCNDQAVVPCRQKGIGQPLSRHAQEIQQQQQQQTDQMLSTAMQLVRLAFIVASWIITRSRCLAHKQVT